MKRSEINAVLRDAVEFCRKMNFQLPPWAYWSPEDWAQAGHECDEIRDNMLGWDITDYGHGKFREIGLALFTIRNGNLHNSKYKKPYAEKLLISQEDYSSVENRISEVLSDLEMEVLTSYLEGKSYQEIAHDLHRHVKSIDNALQRVKRKLEKSLNIKADF